MALRLLALAAFATALPAFAQPAPRPSAAAATPAGPAVQVALPAQPPTVGDRIELVLTVQAPEEGLAGEPRFPVWGRTWGEAEIVEQGKPEKVQGPPGEALWRQRIVIAAFRPGRVPLPPVEVALPYRDRTVQARTSPDLAFEVRSVIPADQKEPEPKPAAPPRRLPLGDLFVGLAIGLACACALLGYLLFRRTRKVAGQVPAAPALPAFEELLGELDRLGADPAAPAVQTHTRISQALRRYFGRSLSFPAMESTTTEIQRRLLGRRIPSTLVRRTVELLRACDLVKFARQEVAPERVQERIAAARDLAREYERQIHPPELASTPSTPSAPSAGTPARWEAAG